MDTTVAHHPVLKPCLKNKNNSIVIPFSRIEQQSDKLCMRHLPVVEIISDESEGRLLPVSVALRKELFALHRQATFISTTGGMIEEALEGDLPTNPNTAPQAGAGRWPSCPKEVDTLSGEPTFLIIVPYKSSSRCSIIP